MRSPYAAMTFLVTLGVWAADESWAEYAPVPGEFPLTRWAKDVSPENVLPEYPRPMLVRKDWMNLNGLWDYAVVAKDAQPPTSYRGKILVPFPIEAPLSGVGKMIHGFQGRDYRDSRLWYQRSFKTPAAWKNKRVLLHSSIVSWVLFNEGWGIGQQVAKGDFRLKKYEWFDLKAVTARVIALDPTRLINHESGAGGGENQGKNPFDAGAGHIVDFHCYGSLSAPKPEAGRAAVIGEYGYAKYLDTCKKYAPFVKDPGVSGYVWTQISDIENERNGLMTYDRSKFTEDPEKVAAENERYYGEATRQ